MTPTQALLSKKERAKHSDSLPCAGMGVVGKLHYPAIEIARKSHPSICTFGRQEQASDYRNHNKSNGMLTYTPLNAHRHAGSAVLNQEVTRRFSSCRGEFGATNN